MLKNENIICISSIDWDFIWQIHQEIMTILASNGNRILFIENTGVRAPRIKDIPRLKKRFLNWRRGVRGIRKEKDNLYIYSPLVLPFPYSRIIRKINKFILLSILRKWLNIMDFDNPVIWTFLPTGTTLDLVNNLNKKLIIYHCADNFINSSLAAKKIKNTERVLIKRSNLVFTTSKSLYLYCLQYSNNVYFFPSGVDVENFTKIRITDIERPKDLDHIKRPIIGYIGGIHRWFNQKLLKSIAERNPNFSFVLVGPIQIDVSVLLNINNIYFIGVKEHHELPQYIKFFDVGIIPYLCTEYTKSVYPIKLNEYLALEKPVVSTALPEIKMFNKKYEDIVYVAKDGQEFGECIEKALREDNERLRRKRIEIAKENSWQNRIEQMSNLIEETIEKKRQDKEARWKENLLSFYHHTRKRIIKFATVSILIYLILFYTPFIWFCAKPLKIVDVPRKADIIVVFGGGVGETGSPGKSTIERARYAAQLYNQGLAPQIIFSSGYNYIYNDAQNMKLFAISMGVPEEDIILEQKAGSAYENVKFSKDILYKRGWKEILLVSSPYNMRRVSLVFKKIASDINVKYVPVPYSQFYERSRRVKLEQIRAIVHEYLGIVYYWWKGWI
jgi:uncharacterized SAM-binding protein YcdF (DUF218 family)